MFRGPFLSGHGVEVNYDDAGNIGIMELVLYLDIMSHL